MSSSLIVWSLRVGYYTEFGSLFQGWLRVTCKGVNYPHPSGWIDGVQECTLLIAQRRHEAV